MISPVSDKVLKQNNNKLSDLGIRTLSACVLSIIAFGLIFSGVSGTLLLVVIAGSIMLWEWTSITSRINRPFILAINISLFITSCCMYTFVTPQTGLLTVMAGGILLFSISLFLGTNRMRKIVPALWQLSGYALITMTAIGLIMLRRTPDAGLQVVLWIILVVVSTDIGGYFIGRLIGGPKLAPRLSPKKTWSGVVGGWSFAVCIGLLFSWVTDGTQAFEVCVLSVVLSLISQIGDLSESSFKRLFNIKDASRIIPGHGGMLDRVDGFIPVVLFVSFLTMLRDMSVFVW